MATLYKNSAQVMIVGILTVWGLVVFLAATAFFDVYTKASGEHAPYIQESNDVGRECNDGEMDCRSDR